MRWLRGSFHAGLSPLARGNRDHGHAGADGDGPIPARAGEPSCGRTAPACSGAYPRSRGGTANMAAAVGFYLGLSPLARGNRVVQSNVCIGEGPIPARAGEPVPFDLCAQIVRAYPRSRGGTCKPGRTGDQRQGLSPLARGNPTRQCVDFHAMGPIPARAGEPGHRAAAARARRAYPRSRGGTVAGR